MGRRLFGGTGRTNSGAMTDTIASGGHLMIGSAQNDKAPARAGRDSSETAASGFVTTLRHRWPTWLALALVVATFADGLPALEFLAWLLVVMSVCYLIFGSMRGEFRKPGVLMLQTAGLLGFGVLALLASAVDHGLGWYVLVERLARSRCLGLRPPSDRKSCASGVGGVVLRRRPARRRRDGLHVVAVLPGSSH